MDVTSAYENLKTNFPLLLEQSAAKFNKVLCVITEHRQTAPDNKRRGNLR
jgi:hypothetical protein